MGVTRRQVQTEIRKIQGNNRKRIKPKGKRGIKKKSETKAVNKAYELRQNVTPSPSEQKIIDFLVSEGVEFEREVPFAGLKGKAGSYLYFDFYLPNFRLLIEFNGYHHYNKSSPNYDNQRRNDQKKYTFCMKNNYHFLAIPFWKDPLDEICKKLDEIEH